MKDNIKNNLIEDFQLPKYIKGKTFAEASKAIDNKFKDRTDPYSTQTKEELLERLAKAQEYVKMQESLKTNSQEVPDQMQGEIPEGMNEFWNGGYSNSDATTENIVDEGNNFESAANIGGTVLQGLNTLVNSNGNQPDEDGQKSVGGGALSGAATGASMGSVVPGVGTAIGAIGGAIAGGISTLFGNKKRRQELNKKNYNESMALNAQLRPSTFEKGGYMNKYPWGGTMFGRGVYETLNNIDDNVNAINKLNPSTPITREDYVNSIPNTTQANNPTPAPTPQSTSGRKVLDWMGENYGDILSYAPVVSNLFSSVKRSNMDRPVQNSTKLNTRYKRDLVDEGALQNIVNQNNINRSLSEASGGDLGALRSNMIAGSLGKTKALSDAYLKADEMNRRENQIAQQFDTNIDQFNATQDERTINRRERARENAIMDEAAYQTAKNEKRVALAEDIGKIGREQSNKKLVREMLGYRWNGEYWIDPKTGDRKTEDQMNKLISSTNDNLFGGYLKKK